MQSGAELHDKFGITQREFEGVKKRLKEFTEGITGAKKQIDSLKGLIQQAKNSKDIRSKILGQAAEDILRENHGLT